MSELHELAVTLRRFAADRDWERYHSPKNLTMAMMVEVGELMEHFEWMTETQSRSLSAEKSSEVRLELADVLIYLVRLADQLNIDLLDAARDKIVINARKYPAAPVPGAEPAS